MEEKIIGNILFGKNLSKPGSLILNGLHHVTVFLSSCGSDTLPAGRFWRSLWRMKRQEQVFTEGILCPSAEHGALLCLISFVAQLPEEEAGILVFPSGKRKEESNWLPKVHSASRDVIQWLTPSPAWALSLSCSQWLWKQKPQVNSIFVKGVWWVVSGPAVVSGLLRRYTLPNKKYCFTNES